MAISPHNIDLDHYSIEDLLVLRDRVLKKLPTTTIEDLDLSLELVLRYQAAKELLDNDDDSPLNQRAQANNSLISMLKTLSDQQQELFNATRLQRLERALGTALEKFPMLHDAFFDAYEKAAEDLGI